MVSTAPLYWHETIVIIGTIKTPHSALALPLNCH
jgi:hypothetical protein